MREVPFTFNEHVQLATDLDGMWSTIMQHITRLSESYPKTSRQVKRARNVQRAIDSLRCEMDTAFYREFPGLQFRHPHYEWVHTPYYNPKNKSEAKCHSRTVSALSTGDQR